MCETQVIINPLVQCYQKVTDVKQKFVLIVLVSGGGNRLMTS